jgi:quercetin dioxygenase-like cupin family protein
MTAKTTPPSLEGWDITHADKADWAPWGEGDNARAKVLGSADGYLVMLVEAQAGYEGSPHQHEHAEFFYLVRGRLRNQGQELMTGDGYAAAAGSVHDDFVALEASTYVVTFRL